MNNNDHRQQELLSEMEEMRARLGEAEETIRAIREGEVDTLVVSGPEGDQIYTLKGAEHAYRLLVEAMNEGALVLTPDGSIAYSNRTFAAMLNVPLESIVGTSIFHYISEEDVAAVKELLDNDRQPNGRADVLSAVVTDLTEHKETEATLEAYREHLEELVTQRTFELVEANRKTASILESIDDAFIAFDKEWRFTYVNEQAERILGRSKEDLLSRSIWEIFPDTIGMPFYDACIKAASTNEAVHFEGYSNFLNAWIDNRIYPSTDGVAVYFEDITERKQAEEALRESEDRLRLALIATELGTWDYNPITGALRWDARCKELFGLPSEVEVNYDTFLAGLHPEDRDSTHQVVQHTFDPASGGIFDIEYRTVGLRDGGILRWVRATGRAFFNEAHQAVRFIGTVQNITARKQAEELLQKYKLLSENSRDMVLFVRRDGKIIEANNAAVSAYGYTRDELLTLNIFDLRAPESVPLTEEQMAKADAGGILFETVHKRKDGSVLNVEISSRGTDMDGQRVLLSIIRDITKRKRAEESLYDSQALLRAVTEGSPDPIFIKDRQSRMMFGNSALLRVWGKPMDEVIGKNDRELYDDPAIGEAMIANDRMVMESGRSQVIEEVVQLPDGYRTYLSTKTPYRNSKGEIIGILGVARDITKRKQAEEALRDLQQSTAQSLALLDTIQAYAPVGIAFADREFRYVRVNEELAIMNGISVDDHLGHTVAEMVPELWPQLEPIYRQVLDGESFLDVEISGETSADPGKQRSWLASYYPVRVHGNEISGIGMIVLDVTERKRDEDALRESEEKYRSLFSSLLEGFCIIEMVFDADNKPIDYRFLEINPAFEDQTGLHEAQGKLMRELAPDVEAHWFETYGKIALTGEPARFVNQVKTLNRWYDVSAYRVGGQESRKVAVLFSDITEYKQAEDALIRSRAEAERRAAELEAFVSSMADGVVLFDTEPKVLMFNEAVMKIVGAPTDVSAEEWGLQHELFTLEGEPVPREEYPSERALRGEETKDARFKMVTLWNESVVGISGSPVRDMQGRVIGGALSFRDASKRVELEKYREDLYQRERHITEVLQGTLIPTKIPQEVCACKFAVKYQPALDEAEVGGDFYDIFDLGDGKVGVIIGDVVGKGLTAAVRVSAARYTIRGYAYQGLNPSEVMRLTNDALYQDRSDEGNMLTACFMVVDTRSNKVVYANAGHEPPLVMYGNGAIEEFLLSGMPMGIIAGLEYKEWSHSLLPGDRIVMITDGISEARSDSLVLFEKRGVIEYLAANSEDSPEDLIDGLLGAAVAHAGGHLQDDAAVVVFEHIGREVGDCS